MILGQWKVVKMVNSNYNLYYTLNLNIPSENISKEERNSFLSGISLLDEEEKKAFVKLIAEHSKIQGIYRENEIPFGGVQKDGELNFKLSNFPNDLVWILFRFVKVIKLKK